MLDNVIGNVYKDNVETIIGTLNDKPLYAYTRIFTLTKVNDWEIISVKNLNIDDALSINFVINASQQFFPATYISPAGTKLLITFINPESIAAYCTDSGYLNKPIRMLVKYTKKS